MALFRRVKRTASGPLPPQAQPMPPIDASMVPPCDEHCPDCGSPAIHIWYGAPNPALVELFNLGLAWPGGAMSRVLGGDAPTHRCPDCETNWVGNLYDVTQPEEGLEEVRIRSRLMMIGIRAEHQYLAQRLGVPDPLSVANRMPADKNGVPCDMWIAADGQRVFLFDVSEFFGHWP